jgi:GxxExxY protein
VAQATATVRYRGVVVGESRLDMIVGGLVIVELKAVERLHALHTSQALSYIQATGLPLALLINFNIPILTKGVRRVLPLRAE